MGNSLCLFLYGAFATQAMFFWLAERLLGDGDGGGGGKRKNV